MSRVFYFNLTYRCQYRCRYCFSHTTSGDSRRPDIGLASFCEYLQANQINVGDRIVLNGGEPTTHPEFLAILDAAVSSHAEVVLYTNGAAFADGEFLSDALSVGECRITIPIHGGEALHDYITNCSGSWKAACKAMQNIANAGRARCLEPKIIVSDRLAKSGFDIARFVDDHICTRSAICDIVITGQVNTKVAIMNGVVASHWNAIMHYAEREIIRCSNKWSVKFYDLPVCRASEGFRLFLKSYSPRGRYAAEMYFADGLVKPKVVLFPPDKRFSSCKDCSLREVCTSITSDYYVTMIDGTDVIRVME